MLRSLLLLYSFDWSSPSRSECSAHDAAADSAAGTAANDSNLQSA